MKNILIKSRIVILDFLTNKISLAVLKIVCKPNLFKYNIDELQCLPTGSLGNDLYRLLEDRKLSLLTHYARRDLQHVLLGYDTTDEGEACLQRFKLGKGRFSFPVLANVLYRFVTMPELWEKMKQAYRLGKKGNSIHGWEWYKLLPVQTEQLRNQIFNHQKQKI